MAASDKLARQRIGAAFHDTHPGQRTGRQIALDMNGVQVEYGDLVINSESTQELLEYVKKLDPAMSL